MDKNTTSTIAGGVAGLALLQSVRWEQIPHGEAWKLLVAVGLALIGYLMYKGEK